MGEDMKFERPSPVGILVLLIPFLAMFYMIASNELGYRKNTEYRLEVTGYDPRDLLTGHYVTFRYNWPDNTPNRCAKDQECFACLTGDPKKPDIRFVAQNGLPLCDAALSLGHYSFIGTGLPQPPGDLTRYHVSEIEGPVLDQMLREPSHRFEVGMLIFSDHRGQLKNFYVDGQTIRELFD